MTQTDALAFLAANQPLPADADLDEDRITRFDHARRVLAAHPHPSAARLLLHAFGDGSGFGVYQLVEDALRAQPREAVIEALLESLRSRHPGVVSWSVEIALEYQDARLDEPMRDLLGAPGSDTDYFVASYLVERGVAADAQAINRARVGADEELLLLLDEVPIAPK